MAQAALARIAKFESGEDSGFRRGGSDVGVVCAFTADLGTPPGITGGLIDMICSVRKDRQEQFPGQLGSDSTWDVLLQLYASHIGQYRLNISKLTARTGTPGTTVLRALSLLSSEGFVSRSADPVDRRRVFVALSPAGLAAMNRYFLKTGTRAVFL